MARLFACLLILLLGGCGMAVSEKPMFTAADTAGAPILADGVWLMKDDPACRVDVALPVSRWPACASWVEHRDGQWSEPSGGTMPTIKPLENDILFVGGKIGLMQVGFRDGGTEWDGVRNNAARLHLRAMQVGDEAFFYRSVQEPAIVGIMRIVRGPGPDPKDGDWVSVRVEPVRPIEPVTLKAIKAEPSLAKMELIRQSRLSVAPVRDEEWTKVLEMSGL